MNLQQILTSVLGLFVMLVASLLETSPWIGLKLPYLTFGVGWDVLSCLAASCVVVVVFFSIPFLEQRREWVLAFYRHRKTIEGRDALFGEQYEPEFRPPPGYGGAVPHECLTMAFLSFFAYNSSNALTHFWDNGFAGHSEEPDECELHPSRVPMWCWPDAPILLNQRCSSFVTGTTHARDDVQVLDRMADVLRGATGLELAAFLNRDGAQGFVGHEPPRAEGDPVSVVVCFRGTEPTEHRDWMVDINTSQTPVSEGCVLVDTHDGFASAYTSLSDDVKDQLRTIVARCPGRTRLSLRLTGHSMGGAMASIAAFRLAQFLAGEVRAARLGDIEELDLQVYTYGSPRVGNPRFGREAFKYLRRPRDPADAPVPIPQWRFEYAGDPVVTVPHWGLDRLKPAVLMGTLGAFLTGDSVAAFYRLLARLSGATGETVRLMGTVLLIVFCGFCLSRLFRFRTILVGVVVSAFYLFYQLIDEGTHRVVALCALLGVLAFRLLARHISTRLPLRSSLNVYPGDFLIVCVSVKSIKDPVVSGAVLFIALSALLAMVIDPQQGYAHCGYRIWLPQTSELKLKSVVAKKGVSGSSLFTKKYAESVVRRGGKALFRHSAARVMTLSGLNRTLSRDAALRKRRLKPLPYRTPEGEVCRRHWQCRVAARVQSREEQKTIETPLWYHPSHHLMPNYLLALDHYFRGGRELTTGIPVKPMACCDHRPAPRHGTLGRRTPPRGKGSSLRAVLETIDDTLDGLEDTADEATSSFWHDAFECLLRLGWDGRGKGARKGRARGASSASSASSTSNCGGRCAGNGSGHGHGTVSDQPLGRMGEGGDDSSPALPSVAVAAPVGDGRRRAVAL